MNVRLIYNLITPIAFCLLASCSANEPEMPSGEVAIEFYAGGKARSSESDNLKLSPFRVFGDLRHSGNNASVNIITNMPVVYNPTTDAWETEETYYWFPFFEHSFVAICPASLLQKADADIQYQKSQLQFSYTLPSDYTQTTDILAATHRRKYVSDATDAVCMRFSHIMTKINVAAALDDKDMQPDAYMEFSRMELTGFKSKATFAVTPSSLQSNDRTDDRIVEISGHAKEGTFIIPFNTPIKVSNHEEFVNFFEGNDAILMLPQSFELTSDARIVLTYTINGSGLENEVTIPLSGNKWDSGRSYIYQFTVDKWGFKLAHTTIADWEGDKCFNVEVTVDGD